MPVTLYNPAPLPVTSSGGTSALLLQKQVVTSDDALEGHGRKRTEAELRPAGLSWGMRVSPC